MGLLFLPVPLGQSFGIGLMNTIQKALPTYYITLKTIKNEKGAVMLHPFLQGGFHDEK